MHTRSPFTARRDALGYTQHELARLAQTTRATVAQLDTGRIENPSLAVSDRLRKALRLDERGWSLLLRRNARWRSRMDALKESLRVA